MKSAAISELWRPTWLRLAGLLAAAILVGLAVDAVFAVLALALALALAWQFRQLFLLDRWLLRRRLDQPPRFRGPWTRVFAAVFARIRESRRQRQRLASILKEYRDAANAVTDGVLVVDRGQIIRWYNVAAADLLGLSRRDGLGRPITAVIRHRKVREWLGAERPDSDGIIAPSPVDASVWLQLRLFDHGQDRRLLIARDVTEVRRTEAMRRDFVANVSHELRTPLTVISGYLETMAEEAEPEWRRIIDTVEQQSTRMKAIVEDLLTLSRLDSTSRLEGEQQVPVEGLLKALVAEAEMLSRGRHRIDLQCETDAALLGSATDLRSAFTNLLSNAVRYTPAGGRIVAEWRQGPGEFAVRDNGPGIAVRHLPRLTERFYRVAADRSRSSGGTGLGLAIVKHILALHGAVLEIRSEPGVGSEFICRFPAERIITGRGAA